VSERTRSAVPDYTIGAVTRAAELLAAFERPPHTFRLSDLADRLGVTRNLTFRLLRTLELSGMIYRRDDYYLLGPRTSELGRLALRRLQPLVDAGQPVLEALKTETGETVYLCAMEGQEAVCIAAVESDFFVRGVLNVGGRLPLHAGGGNKVLLAWLSPEMQAAVIDDPRGLRIYTPLTPNDPAELRARLAIIRRDGYSVALEEVVLGADAIGVPVFGPDGTVVAGLGLVGPADRVRPRLHHPLPDQLRAAADRIRQRLLVASAT
jgi:IclR family KDG regulon transcriptional repressor